LGLDCLPHQCLNVLVLVEEAGSDQKTTFKTTSNVLNVEPCSLVEVGRKPRALCPEMGGLSGKATEIPFRVAETG
jgi:hypothetical protein